MPSAGEPGSLAWKVPHHELPVNDSLLLKPCFGLRAISRQPAGHQCTDLMTRTKQRRGSRQKPAVARAVVIFLFRRVHTQYAVDVDTGIIQHLPMHQIPSEHPWKRANLEVDIDFAAVLFARIDSHVDNFVGEPRGLNTSAGSSHLITAGDAVIHDDDFPRGHNRSRILVFYPSS